MAFSRAYPNDGPLSPPSFFSSFHLPPQGVCRNERSSPAGRPPAQKTVDVAERLCGVVRYAVPVVTAPLCCIYKPCTSNLAQSFPIAEHARPQRNSLRRKGRAKGRTRLMRENLFWLSLSSFGVRAICVVKGKRCGR